MTDTFGQYHLTDVSFLFGEDIKHNTMDAWVDEFAEDGGVVVWCELFCYLVRLAEQVCQVWRYYV